MRVYAVISRNIISLPCVMHLNVPLPKAVTCKAGNTNAALCFPSILSDLGPNTDK